MKHLTTEKGVLVLDDDIYEKIKDKKIFFTKTGEPYIKQSKKTKLIRKLVNPKDGKPVFLDGNSLNLTRQNLLIVKSQIELFKKMAKQVKKEISQKKVSSSASRFLEPEPIVQGDKVIVPQGVTEEDKQRLAEILKTYMKGEGTKDGN